MKKSEKRRKMNLLTVDNITKTFTQRKLFEQASFYLQEGEKIGIVGVKYESNNPK